MRAAELSVDRRPQAYENAVLAEYADLMGAPPDRELDARLAWCASQFRSEREQLRQAAALYM